MNAPRLTREALQRMNDLVGTYVEYTEPAEVLLDVDGVPSAVGSSSTTNALFGGVIVTNRDVERLGLTDYELATNYPNVRVISAYPTKED